MRTRTSFELGAFQLGGHAVVLQPGKDAWPIEFDVGTVMDGEAEEHIAEVARVLSRYVDLIGVRAFPKFKDWSVDREDRVLQILRAVRDGAGDQHGNDHASVPGTRAHHGAATAFRHAGPARQEIRADLDLPSEAAQHGRGEFRADHRDALRHGRDVAVPDARVRARQALHGFRRAERRRERRLVPRQPRHRRRLFRRERRLRQELGRAAVLRPTGKTKSRSAKSTRISSWTKRRWN